MSASIRLVVGLGNPGREYASTRHNAGFRWVEALARDAPVRLVNEHRFHGLVGRIRSEEGDVRLALPQTFYNRSGQAVAALARFLKIDPAEILVVHDELDLKPGEVKLKKGGGNAGNNGLKDITAHLGTPDFWRLRLGIGHPRDWTPGEQEVVDYVLHPPRAAEHALIEDAVLKSLRVWPHLRAGDMERAMHELHTKPPLEKKIP